MMPNGNSKVVTLLLLLGIARFTTSQFHVGQVNVEVVAVDAVITPAPAAVANDIGTLQRDFVAEVLRRQESIDPVELANILLTAFPQSLREIAATNVPQVSRILWSEFLDDNTPSWFAALPTEIQGYLSGQFGPSSLRPQTTVSYGTDSFSTTTSSPAQATVIQTSIVTVGPSGNSPSASNIAEAPTAASSSELSTAQKIGIGVGVPLGIATLAAALLCCFLYRRRRTKGKQNTLESPRGQSVGDRVPTPAFTSFSNVPIGERRREGGGEADALLSLPASSRPPRNSRFPDGVDGNAYDDYANNRQTYDLYKNDNPYVLPTTTSNDPLRIPSSSSNVYPSYAADPNSGTTPWRSRGAHRGSRNSRTSLSSLNLHPVPEVPEVSSEGHYNRSGRTLPVSPDTERSSDMAWALRKNANNGNYTAVPTMDAGSSSHSLRKPLSPGEQIFETSRISPLTPNPRDSHQSETDMGTHPAMRIIDHAPPRSTGRDSLGPFADSYGYSPYGDDSSYDQIDESPVRSSENGFGSVSMGIKPNGMGENGDEWPLRNKHATHSSHGQGMKSENGGFQGGRAANHTMKFKRGSETRPNWHQMYEGT